MAADDRILVDATPELREAALDWVSISGANGGSPTKTLEAYRRDLEQFFRFLTEHLGGPGARRFFQR